MKMRKILAVVLAVLLIAAITSGCVTRDNDDESPSTPQSPSPSGAASSGSPSESPEKVMNTDPVKVWIGAGAKIEDFTALATSYKAETGIDVEILEFTDLSATDKLALDGPAGNGGDIYYQGGGGSLGKAVEQGLFAEITPEMTDLSVYVQAGLDNYTYKGKIYGIPTGLEVPALIYNKALISEIPATWDEFIDVAKALNDFPNKKYGFLMDGGNPFFTNFLTDAYGGYVFKNSDAGYDVNDIGINNEGAKKAFSLFTGYVTKDNIIPKNMEFALMQQNFKDGLAGAIIDGPWSISQYKEAGIDIGVAAVPPVKDAGNSAPRMYSGAYGYCLSAYASNPVGGMQFIEYLAANPDNAMVYYNRTQRAPALKSLLERDEIKNDPIQNGFAQQAVNSYPQPNVPQMDVTWGPLMEAAQAVFNDGYDPSEALDAAAAKLKDSIAVMGQ